jgi:hypothetical protein
MTVTDFPGIRAAVDAEHEKLNEGAAGPIPGQQDIAGGEADGAAEPAAAPAPEELRVPGTTQLSMFNLGGKRATSSTLRLAGGSVDLFEGQAIEKGTVLSGTWTAVVFEVGQVDKIDAKTGLVVSAKQKHVARITDLTVDAPDA